MVALDAADLFGSSPAVQINDDWPLDWEQQFRREYPNKVGMAKAVRKLQMLRKNGESWDKIIDGVQRYAAWLNERSPVNWRPAPKMPTTFLNNDCWKDEYRIEANAQQSASQRAFDRARQAYLSERGR